MNSAAKPFDSIDSAYEFILLLEESVIEAIREVEGHSQQAQGEQDARRVEALKLALFKLEQLSGKMHQSRRILNDLRTIRRLLFAERVGA